MKNNKKACSYVMRAYEVADPTIKALPHDELVTKAKSFIKSRGLKKVAVIESENSYRVVGSVSREKIIELSSIQTNTILLKDLAEDVTQYATLSQEVKEITKIMLKEKEDCIPAVENEDTLQYAGLITIEAVLDAVTKLGSKNLNRIVSDVMERDFPYVKTSDTISKAWRKMNETKHSGLIVVNDDKKVVGVLTHHDLLSSKVAWLPLALKDNSGGHVLYVSDLMNKHVHTIRENVTILEASKQLLKFRVGRLPVVDEEGKLLGVIHRRILLELLSDCL
ncbi:MAG TPA: CBS domain-containing protein [Geobacterales bacterium]|nr:CBS domain-containing protein [Geobacterales bacterium]